jgi:WD40 repeat protein
MDELRPAYEIKIQDAKEITCLLKARNLNELVVGCWNIPEIILISLKGDIVSATHPDRLGKLKGHKKGISSLKYFERKCLLISGGFDCEIFLWNLVGRQKLIQFTAHKHYVCSIQIESNGEFFYTISRDNSIREWNTKTGEPSEQFNKYFSNTCDYSFTLSPCEKFIAAINYEKNHKIDMFNILSKELFCEFDDLKKPKEDTQTEALNKKKKFVKIFIEKLI